MKKAGKQSLIFEHPVYLYAQASVVGPKEGEGPLKNQFDLIVEDPYFGEKTWEEGESKMVTEAISIALRKADLTPADIRYLFEGDLLSQLIATTFGVMDFQIPVFGLYGACSTAGEALSLGSVFIENNGADYVMAVASSHFGSAEKQFRYPLEYGNQRPLAATWTVVGCGAFVLSANANPKRTVQLKITGITTGVIKDYGVKDSTNMGACMAPAAADLIYQNLKDFHRAPTDYDRIITGDLGLVGQEILIKLLMDNGIDISEQHMDCGIEIFDIKEQDVHSGGSGCGCCASVLAGSILPKLLRGEYKRILFVPTGALLSTVSYNEGQSVPGIAHGVVIEREEFI